MVGLIPLEIASRLSVCWTSAQSDLAYLLRNLFRLPPAPPPNQARIALWAAIPAKPLIAAPVEAAPK